MLGGPCQSAQDLTSSLVRVRGHIVDLQVGNIPYDISEEQLIKVFSEVGRVVDFRLVSDRDQGKFKGYGFCEYEDAETAASAVRNLNDVEVGGRPLRLDYADADPVQDGGDRRGGGADSRGRTPNMLPPLPEGVPIPPGVSSTDVITQTIASLPPNQLMDILTQMKALTTHAPEQARHLLVTNPQLAYAVFHAMLMMNVVDPAVVQRVVSETSPAVAGGPHLPPPPPPMGVGPQAPMHAEPMMPPGPSGPPHMPSQGYPPMPSTQPAPMLDAPSAPVAAPPQLDEQQRMLLQQVLQLTPEQIQALPPDQRAGIMQLKAQFGH